jgi:glycosyltransferase involved in cell wall biosynthesis
MSLRVVHVHWGFPPIIGGVESPPVMLLPEMVKRGHGVGLLTGSVEGTPEREELEGVAIRRSPLLDLNWLYKRGLEGLEEEVAGAYERFFDEIRPDLIHAHNMHYFSDVHAKLLAQQARTRAVPLVLTAHNVWDDILSLRLTRDVAWTHIIAVSHYIKMELIGVGVDEQKITTIHHGVDVDTFHPKVSPERILDRYPQLKGKPVILHPARMGMAKGCDVTIKAMAVVREQMPEAMLVLTGTKNTIDWGLSQEKDIAYLVDLIKLLGMKDCVVVDVFPLGEMPELYSAADVVVYPSSLPEPFGLTMLEALASGKPIIVSRIGGMPEIIQDAIDGYVIPPRDFEARGARIIGLLENERLRRRLGTTGRETARVHYPKEMMAERNLEIYSRVLGSWHESAVVSDRPDPVVET